MISTDGDYEVISLELIAKDLLSHNYSQDEILETLLEVYELGSANAPK